MKEDVPNFQKMTGECLELRNTIVDMIHNAGSGHTGGSLSVVDIMWTLYSSAMNVSPDALDDEGRDRMVLSKGHAAPALYAVLARLGFIDPEELNTLRKTGSILQGHPDMRKTPGVEMSTGSLGMGISVGVGMSLAANLSGTHRHTYVIVGDGELQEGQNWEAMMSANKFGLEHLVVIVDMNGVQLDGTTEDIMPMLDIPAKIKAFGFDVRECDGHDCESIYNALVWARDGGNIPNQPKAVIANTIKGKGVSFMEGDHAWHGKQISPDDYAIAKMDLKGGE